MHLEQRLYDRIRSAARWTPLPAQPASGASPTATHEGWVALGEETLHVFQLTTGETVIDEDSMQSLMNSPFGLWCAFLHEHPEWEDDVEFAPEGLAGIKPGELSAKIQATKAFVQWAVSRGLARHPERAPGYLQTMDYQAALERQAMARRKPKLRLIRPPREHP